jgi:hypothetical protein
MTAMTEKAADRYAARLSKGVWFTPEKPIKDIGHQFPPESKQLHFDGGWAQFSMLSKAEVAFSPGHGPNEFMPEGGEPIVHVHAVGPADDPAWMSISEARALAKAILKTCRLAEETAA